MDESTRSSIRQIFLSSPVLSSPDGSVAHWHHTQRAETGDRAWGDCGGSDADRAADRAERDDRRSHAEMEASGHRGCPRRPGSRSPPAGNPPGQAAGEGHRSTRDAARPRGSQRDVRRRGADAPKWTMWPAPTPTNWQPRCQDSHWRSSGCRRRAGDSCDPGNRSPASNPSSSITAETGDRHTAAEVSALRSVV